MSTQYGFSFAKDRCVQCYGCEVACKSWREGEVGVRWRRVSNIWYGRYPQVRSASVSVSCMHCVDPQCAKTCPVKAITKREEDGIVAVDRDKCIGCKTCLKSCPFWSSAIRRRREDAEMRPVPEPDGPEQGITPVRRDLSHEGACREQDGCKGEGLHRARYQETARRVIHPVR